MSHIPSWVYILFLALLYIGVRRCFTRVISVERLAITPIIFIFLSIRSTAGLFGFDLSILGLLILGILAGMSIGHFQVRNRVILADKSKKLIQIPGDVSMLIMVMIIFFIEFFIHYAMEAHWQVSTFSTVRVIAIILSGLVVGVSVGRNLTYFWKFTHAQSQNLVKG